MKIKCYICGDKTGTQIDVSHDSHSYCWEHRDIVQICDQCSLSVKRCPICGGNLTYESESLIKKSFFHEPTRRNLGL